jgi:DNA-binding LytR/AlgR family response regulator
MSTNGDRLLVLGGDRIAIRHRASTHVVAREEVICARAAKNGTWIVTSRGQFKVREPMNSVVDKLRIIGIVRIHRAMAVNGDKVRSLLGRSQHRLAVVLDGDECFEVGRQFQREIRLRFGAARRAS